MELIEKGSSDWATWFQGRTNCGLGFILSSAFQNTQANWLFEGDPGPVGG